MNVYDLPNVKAAEKHHGDACDQRRLLNRELGRAQQELLRSKAHVMILEADVMRAMDAEKTAEAEVAKIVLAEQRRMKAASDSKDSRP